MPISIIGPMKMRKLAMNRKKTRNACVHQVREPIASAAPTQMACAVPHHVIPSSPNSRWTTKTTVMKTAMIHANR